jgi:hypothetical protein
MRRATDWMSVWRRFPDRSRTTWCSGSRAIARSSPATRSSTSATAVEINARWLQQQGVTRETVVEGLRPLLERPVEHMLATHGGPFDRAALERALASS